MAGRHEYLEHTSEVCLRLEGDSLAELFVEAGRGLAELLADDPGQGTLGPWVTVSLSSPDPEALLVDFIDELVFRSEVDHAVYTEFVVRRVDGGTLEAAIAGRPIELLRTQVKAATLHGLRIEQHDGRLHASVVLDV